MLTFAERLQVLQAESERIRQYIHALPATALTQASACAQWQVQDVIAHLIGVAETYAGSITRGLQGDTGPLPGRLPAGQTTASLAAESIAQRSIAARQSLGEHLLSKYDEADTRLNQAIASLSPAQQAIPCYHPGGLVKAQNFIDLRLKELAVHEWDIRAGLSTEAQLSGASIPSILLTIGEAIASGSLRWAFWAGTSLPAPVRYRFVVSGADLPKSDVVVDGSTLRMEEPRGSVPDVTVHCDAATYVLLVYGRLNLEAALAAGRLVVDGDRALVLAFGQWFRGI
ncbi:MAG: maleylpyruvate isomerase family mycothiol-dependent enzyme [Candidatus Tectimicrobiota bacterium]